MTMAWHTDPPEWAAYVSDVLVFQRDAEVHVSIDMRCKRVDADADVSSDGRIVVAFYPDHSEDVKWPEDPGPWAHVDRTPTLALHVGDVLGSDMTVAACSTGRYTTRVVCLRAVDWDHARLADHGPTRRLGELNTAVLDGAVLSPEEQAERADLTSRFDGERLRVLR